MLRHAGLGVAATSSRCARQAARNLERLVPFVEQGAKVLAINPTCSMMMRREYPELLAGGAAAASREGSRRP